jgi:ribosomal protein S18 acetylase RimI-like enzyme
MLMSVFINEGVPLIEIRPATINDIPSIVKIRSRALTDEELSGFVVLGNNPYLSVEKLQKEWDEENKLKGDFEVFVAECEGKVIGFIVYNSKSVDDNIDNIVVAKGEQGKGVGRALVEYLEELAKSRGFSVITTDTTENAEGVPWKAYGFWKKIGYEDKGERLLTEYGFKVIPLIKNLK